jgi:DNA-binding GntR family transcriptional regulator
VQQIRLPLETLALELAKARISEEELRTLDSISNRIAEAYDQGQHLESTQADLEFHTVVWGCTGNRRLLTSLRNLMVPYFAYGSVFRLSRPDLSAGLLQQQHASFIDFLSGASDQTAEQCVRFHLGL